MASVSGPTGSATYTYDAEGKRVATDDGAAVTNYLIDTQQPFAQVVAEYDYLGNPSALYVFGLDRISQDRGGTGSTYLADGQGSIRQLTDNTGTVTDTYHYYAFGEDLASTGSTENGFRYTGEQWEANAGFYYLRARWYSPETGSFISIDPSVGSATTPLTMHRYLYANASPAVYGDPTGRFGILGALAPVILSSILAAHTVPTHAVAMPLIHFDKYQGPTLVANNTVQCAMYGRVSRVRPPSNYFVVQWIKGSITLNGRYVSGVNYGKVDFDLVDWTIDARAPAVVYPYQQPLVGGSEIYFWDMPPVQNANGNPYRSGDNVTFSLDLVVTVHSYGKYPTPSRSQFKSPWNPMPLASAPWPVHEVWQMQ
jgi:RHS repeat-associated protein